MVRRGVVSSAPPPTLAGLQGRPLSPTGVGARVLAGMICSGKRSILMHGAEFLVLQTKIHGRVGGVYVYLYADSEHGVCAHVCVLLLTQNSMYTCVCVYGFISLFYS